MTFSVIIVNYQFQKSGLMTHRVISKFCSRFIEMLNVEYYIYV